MDAEPAPIVLIYDGAGYWRCTIALQCDLGDPFTFTLTCDLITPGWTFTWDNGIVSGFVQFTSFTCSPFEIVTGTDGGISDLGALWGQLCAGGRTADPIPGHAATFSADLGVSCPCYVPLDGDPYLNYASGVWGVCAYSDSPTIEFAVNGGVLPLVTTLDFLLGTLTDAIAFAVSVPGGRFAQVSYTGPSPASDTWTLSFGDLAFPSVSTVFTGLAAGDAGSLVVSDTGSTITISLYGPGPALLAKIIHTDGNSVRTPCGPWAAKLYISDIGNTALPRGMGNIKLTGLSVVDAGGTIWSDDFAEVSGMLLAYHAPTVGCS